MLRAGLSIVIATYRRPLLLAQLLGDLAAQTARPERLVIVDGSPESRSVLDVIADIQPTCGWQTVYVPSNHANLSYQRYLGWRAAPGGRVLLYLDDDLRIPRDDAVATVIAPLYADESGDVVGVTARTQARDPDRLGEAPMLAQRDARQFARLVDRFGSARDVPPGGYAPSGQRRLPDDDGRDYAQVDWLQGRVMAYRLDALTANCFSEDLFALDEIRCGLGEDTFLSRQVGARGRMLLAFRARFDHPDLDLPRSYPYQSRRLGVATAYSRRFLNDHYRVGSPPRFGDRAALLKSYLGNNLINWTRALKSFRAFRYAYAWGYSHGTLRGLTRPPTSHNLTAQIDWQADADAALARRQTFAPRPPA